MKTPKPLLTWTVAVLSSVILSGLPAAAQPKSGWVSSTPFGFTTPTYEKQPLPKRLNTAEAWQTVAHNARLVHDYPNSLAAYDKAVQLAFAEARPELIEERGWVHYLAGEFGQAKADFRTAALLYEQQNQWHAVQNVRQMQQFVETHVQKLNALR